MSGTRGARSGRRGHGRVLRRYQTYEPVTWPGSGAAAFTNPDFVAYAESFGARVNHIDSADQLLPTLRRALADDTVSVIACPVDYSANL